MTFISLIQKCTMQNRVIQTIISRKRHVFVKKLTINVEHSLQTILCNTKGKQTLQKTTTTTFIQNKPNHTNNNSNPTQDQNTTGSKHHRIGSKRHRIIMHVTRNLLSSLKKYRDPGKQPDVHTNRVHMQYKCKPNTGLKMHRALD